MRSVEYSQGGIYIENAPEQFRLDTEDLDERVVEPLNLLIDFVLGQ